MTTPPYPNAFTALFAPLHTEQRPAYRTDLRNVMRAEIRRAAEHGASLEQIRAALTAPAN